MASRTGSRSRTRTTVKRERARSARPRQREARIGFAEISATNARLPFDFASAVIDSLVPGTSDERYGRVWLMGQHTVLPDGRIYGRIGFQQAGRPAEIWNPEARDFEARLLTLGQTSPFLIDPQTLRVAFGPFPQAALRDTNPAP